MYRIMIDFETASTERNAAILQFGAVEFGLPFGSTRRQFMRGISVESNQRYKRDFNPATLTWWDNQDDFLRREVFGGSYELGRALEDFATWAEDFAPPNEIELWSRGAGFDCEILQHAFYEILGSYPFDFRKHMCQRTVERLMPDDLVQMVRNCQPKNLIKHNALDDAIAQADMMDVALRNIRWGR